MRAAPSTLHVVVNVVLFQATWIACALGAAAGVPWVGAGAALLAVGVHLAWSSVPLREAGLIGVAMVLGIAWDTGWEAAGWVGFAAGDWIPGLAPYWMVALWAAFATTLNVSMRWLRGRPVLAVLLGGVGGPLAYYAGEGLSALAFAYPWAGLAGQALGWALVTPLLVLVAARLDGVVPAVSPGPAAAGVRHA